MITVVMVEFTVYVNGQPVTVGVNGGGYNEYCCHGGVYNGQPVTVDVNGGGYNDYCM